MKLEIPGFSKTNREHRDIVERVSRGRKLMNDAYIARGRNISPASIFVTFILNLDPAEKFIEQFLQKRGVKLSLTCLLVKASGLALRKHPWVNYMLSGFSTRIIKPSSIDIGVSVAVEGTFTPAAVLRNADQRELSEISTLLKQESEKIRSAEAETMKVLNRIGCLLPTPFLRRLFMRFYINNHRVRRDMVGTFQISMLHRPEVELGMGITFLSTALMVTGGKTRMPFEINGKIIWCSGTRFSISADHRMLDGMKVVNFGSDIIHLMENPHLLEDTPL